MNHNESQLQQQCASSFRVEHKEYVPLLTHPINEGGAYTRVTGAIHKGEGTIPGVPDFLFFAPAEFDGRLYFGLGIELKTLTGRQSQYQKNFQIMFEASGYAYVIVRTLEDFRKQTKEWIEHIPAATRESIASAYKQLENQELQRERQKLQSIIKKK